MTQHYTSGLTVLQGVSSLKKSRQPISRSVSRPSVVEGTSVANGLARPDVAGVSALVFCPETIALSCFWLKSSTGHMGILIEDREGVGYNSGHFEEPGFHAKANSEMVYPQ
jgi:hypothetical protein